MSIFDLFKKKTTKDPEVSLVKSSSYPEEKTSVDADVKVAVNFASNEKKVGAKTFDEVVPKISANSTW